MCRQRMINNNIVKNRMEYQSPTPACECEQKGVVMEKLIANLAARFPDLTEEDVVLSVETVINAMAARLMNGGRIELRGFGSFSLKPQIAELSAGALLDGDVDNQPAVIFKPGQIIRERIHNAA